MLHCSLAVSRVSRRVFQKEEKEVQNEGEVQEEEDEAFREAESKKTYRISGCLIGEETKGGPMMFPPV